MDRETGSWSGIVFSQWDSDKGKDKDEVDEIGVDLFAGQEHTTPEVKIVNGNLERSRSGSATSSEGSGFPVNGRGASKDGVDDEGSTRKEENVVRGSGRSEEGDDIGSLCRLWEEYDDDEDEYWDRAGMPYSGDDVTSEGRSCVWGPHRRGYVLVAAPDARWSSSASDGWQLFIGSESEMRTDTAKGIQLGQHILQLEDTGEVPDNYKEKAFQELGETPEIRAESLDKFKKLLEKERDEHGLTSPLDNDTILLSYLRAAHFNLDAAFQKITDYYRFKQKYSDYCANLIPQGECKAFQNNLLTVLPDRDKYGRRVLIVQAGRKWDPSTCSVRELVRGIMMIVKAAILEPVTQISGAIVIVDVKELGYTQMRHLISLSLAEMLVTWVQDCFPTRLKAIHVVNINALFGLVLNVFKKFLNEKFQKRVIVHNKPDTLNIEKEILTKDLGGTVIELPDNQGMLLHKLLTLYQDRYEEVSKYGYPKEPEKKEKRGWF